MRSLARTALLAALFAATALSAAAQGPARQGTGVITGRVTIGERGAPNVAVALYSEERPEEGRGATVARDTTDGEGYYRLTGIPAGRYNVIPIAPAFIGQSESRTDGPGKSIDLTEGETIEGVDFALVRGGVITGRVREDDGTPVIGERVRLTPLNQQGGFRGFSNTNPFMYETDDRGIYRLYGIPPGKYTISVGESLKEGGVRFGFGGRGYYALTYHPDATDESKATVIELAEGAEVSNVDVVLSGKAKSFAATGRVVDENGKVVANVPVGHGVLLADGSRMGGMGWGAMSDAQGRFRLDGLVPGRYAAFVWSESNAQGYSDPVNFEITGENVGGLELKFRRGATISGVAVIEGTTDAAVLAALPQLTIAVGVESGGLNLPSYAAARVAPDGSFRAVGLRPGKARIYPGSNPPLKGLVLSRVERDGIPQQEIEVAAGVNVSGVRVVFEYATGSIRGTVKLENGPPPSDQRMIVSLHRQGDPPGFMAQSVQADSRGRFLIEGLRAGEYELRLDTYVYSGPPRSLPTVKRNVTVTNGVESEVNLVLDLNAGPQ